MTGNVDGMRPLMRPFLRSERPRGLLLVMRSTEVVGAAVLLVLVVLWHGDAAKARHAAKADRETIVKVTGALRQQCTQQVAEQNGLRDLERADVELQRGLIAADQSNTLITAAVRNARADVYGIKLAKDLSYLATPRAEPAVCAVFSDPLPIAFRAVG